MFIELSFMVNMHQFNLYLLNNQNCLVTSCSIEFWKPKMDSKPKMDAAFKKQNSEPCEVAAQQSSTTTSVEADNYEERLRGIFPRAEEMERIREKFFAMTEAQERQMGLWQPYKDMTEIRKPQGKVSHNDGSTKEG